MTQPLTPGENYRFAIAADAAGQDGIPMGAAYIWTHRPLPLQTRFSLDLLELSFNYPLDMSKVAHLLSFDPPLREFHHPGGQRRKLFPAFS